MPAAIPEVSLADLSQAIVNEAAHLRPARAKSIDVAYVVDAAGCDHRARLNPALEHGASPRLGALVARHQRQHGSEIRARALAGDHQTAGIASEARGVSRDPIERASYVLDRRRKTMPRRQPITHVEN